MGDSAHVSHLPGMWSCPHQMVQRFYLFGKEDKFFYNPIYLKIILYDFSDIDVVASFGSVFLGKVLTIEAYS